MSARVVVALEVVDVDHHQRERRSCSELMFFGSAPALGYASVQLLTQTPPNVTPPTLNLVSNNNGTITLSNQFLSATIGPYGITSLIDLLADPTNILNGRGNQLVWYDDDANVYRFGN